MLLAKKQLQFVNPEFRQHLNHYFEHCLYYDLLLQRADFQVLMSSADPWGYLKQSSSNSRLIEGAEGKELCSEYIGKLYGKLAAIEEETATHYSYKLFGGDAHADRLKNQLYAAYYDVSLSKSSEETGKVFKNNLLLTAIQQNKGNFSGYFSTEKALANISYTRAMQQKRLLNSTIAGIAAHWLPLLKNVLEGILYASFLIVLLIAFLPFTGGVIKSYIECLLWLQLWAPIYAVLNLMMTVYGNTKKSNLLIDNVLSLQSMLGIEQFSIDMASVAGYLSMSVPLIAFYFLRFSSYSLTQLAQSMTAGSVSSGVTDLAMGNIEVGNSRFGNHQAFTSSGFQVATQPQFQSFGISTEQMDGVLLSSSGDGSLSMNTMISPSDLGLDIKFSNLFTESTQESITQAKEKITSEQNILANGINKMVENYVSLGEESLQRHDRIGHTEATSETITEKAVHDSYSELQRRATEAGVTVGALASSMIAGHLQLGPGFASVSADTKMGVEMRAEAVQKEVTELLNDQQFVDSFEQVQRNINSEQEDDVTSNTNSHSLGMKEAMQTINNSLHEIKTQEQIVENWQSQQQKIEANQQQFDINMNQQFFNWLYSVKEMNYQEIKSLSSSPQQKIELVQEFIAYQQRS